jgi:hypothetical protein
VIQVSRIGYRNHPSVVIDLEGIPYFGFWNSVVGEDAAFHPFHDCSFFNSLSRNQPAPNWSVIYV